MSLGRSLALRCRDGRTAAVFDGPVGIGLDPAKREEMHMGDVEVGVGGLMGGQFGQNLGRLVRQQQFADIHGAFLQHFQGGIH